MERETYSLDPVMTMTRYFDANGLECTVRLQSLKLIIAEVLNGRNDPFLGSCKPGTWSG